MSEDQHPGEGRSEFAETLHEQSKRIHRAPVHRGNEQTEIRDRLRRIETRLTAWMEFSGFNSGVEKPVWNPDPGCMVIPSLDARLRDLLAATPAEAEAKTSEVHVIHKNKEVMSFFLPD